MDADTVECPYCAEPIRARAIRCKHCGSDLTPGPLSPATPAVRPQKRGGTWAFVAVPAAVVAVLLMLNQGAFPDGLSGAALGVLPPVSPRPVVVERGGDDSASRLLDYRARVWARVRNDGAAGVVAVEADLLQGAETWTRIERVHLGAGEERLIEFTFSEATLGRGDITYTVRARAD